MRRPDAAEEPVRRVLARYVNTVVPGSMSALGSAGGFSGASLWRVTGFTGEFCLRRWPVDHPSYLELSTIHRVLQTAYGQGVVEVAVPLADRSGHTVVVEEGALWELTRWLTGAADDSPFPSPKRLESALQVLARFHLATTPLSGSFHRPPIGLERRREQLLKLIDGEFALLSRAVESHRFVDDRGIEPVQAQCFLDAFPRLAQSILQQIDEGCRLRIRLQPCIRDIWRDHVLFSGESVTGVVDFGALREDHVACDLSRLLGSLVRDDAAGWQRGLAAYARLRPLSDEDRQLIAAYDRSSVVLSAMNWLRWLYVEKISFRDPFRVRERCAEIAARLERLVRGS